MSDLKKILKMTLSEIRSIVKRYLNLCRQHKWFIIIFVVDMFLLPFKVVVIFLCALTKSGRKWLITPQEKFNKHRDWIGA